MGRGDTRRIAALLALVLTLPLLTYCTLDDDDQGDATATVEATARVVHIPTADADAPVRTPEATIVDADPVEPVATLGPGNSLLVSDSVCRARIPTGWVDDGTGSGTTAGGHRFTLFGNRISGPEAWDRAATLFKDQNAARPSAELSEGDEFVRVVYADDRGFAHRQRFEDRYCDFRVTARGAVSEQEQASWDAIIASLAPAT